MDPGGSTLACGRGGGGVPIPTRGDTLWYYITICTFLHHSCCLPFIRCLASTSEPAAPEQEKTKSHSHPHRHLSFHFSSGHRIHCSLMSRCLASLSLMRSSLLISSSNTFPALLPNPNLSYHSPWVQSLHSPTQCNVKGV